MESWKEELHHHGILGQRWGVRRYQNEDGTLTALGKTRYNAVKGRIEKAYDLKKYNESLRESRRRADKMEAKGKNTEAIRNRVANTEKRIRAMEALKNVELRRLDSYNEDDYVNEGRRKIGLVSGIVASVLFSPILALPTYFLTRSGGPYRDDVERIAFETGLDTSEVYELIKPYRG